MKGIVIIPTYNEVGNIERIIPQILDYPGLDILVVDDNSPDATANLVKDNPQYNKRLFLIEHGPKKGLGKAYITGFKKALEWGYDFVIQMDADLSHDPKHIQCFLDVLDDGFQAVFGSRYIIGGQILNWDLKRRFLSMYANIYAKFMTGVLLSDLTGGYNAYTKEILQKIDLDRIYSYGYMFQIEMKSVVYFSGFKTKEIPIVFVERTIGETKMHGYIIYEAILGCPIIRICKMLKKLPIKK